MKSKQRVMAIIKKQDFDRPAVCAWVSSATKESCDKLNIDFAKSHLNPENAAALAAYTYENLGYDSIMPYFSVVLEAAALGAQIDWGNNLRMPYVRNSIMDEVRAFDVPKDFLDRAPIKSLLGSLRLLDKQYGSEAFILGKIMGPWTLAFHVYGMENFLIETLMNPKMVHEALESLLPISEMFANAQLEAGADMITLADHITADVASPDCYAEFLQPLHNKIIGRFPKNTFVLHCCGKTIDRIALFAEAGFPVFHFDSKNDIDEALEKAGDMLLTGCVNNPVALLNGELKVIEDETKNILNHGIKLIAPECAIPLQVTNASLSQIAQTVKSEYQ